MFGAGRCPVAGCLLRSDDLTEAARKGLQTNTGRTTTNPVQRLTRYGKANNSSGLVPLNPNTGSNSLGLQWCSSCPGGGTATVAVIDGMQKVLNNSGFINNSRR